MRRKILLIAALLVLAPALAAAFWGELVQGVTALAILKYFAGTVLWMLATVGLIVFLWKHAGAKYEYRISFRKAVDLWAMVMITACYLIGGFLFYTTGG